MKRGILFSILALGLLSCGDNTLKVAVIMPMENYELPYGMDAKNGLNLAILDIAPENVEFEYYDTEGKPEFFLKYYEEAAKNGAELVIGPLISKEVKIEDLVKLIDKYKVPLLSPAITNDEYLHASDKFFSVAAPNSVIAANLAFLLSKFRDKNAGIEKIEEVILVQNPENPYSTDITELERKAFENYGIKVVGISEFTGSRQDLIDDLKEKFSETLKNSNSAIVLNLYADNLNDLLLDIRNELNYKGVLAGPDSWDVVESMEEEIPGINIYVAFFFPTENDSTKAFTQRYMEHYKKVPTSFSALAYDAIKVLNEALKKSKVYTSEEIAKRIRFVSTTGLTGEIDFGGDNILEDKSVVSILYSGKEKRFIRRTTVSAAVIK